MKVTSLRSRISREALLSNMSSDTDVESQNSASVRLLEIERNNGSHCGFQLTRGKWDPYPWISSVDSGTAAEQAGVRPGDCLLEVNGEDIVGQRVSEVAEIVKSKPDQVSLLLWNAGVDPQCSPEAVCCGPMPTNLQRLSACMSTILAFLECPVCLDTIPPPTYQCENGHLICIRCRTKSERCPVCRLRYTRGRSLLADQVYNALIDAFNLREEPDESRSAKMQQIFKTKSKNRNIPDIKVTQTHTNKFLARLTGKSNSVDNLSNTKCVSVSNLNTSSGNFTNLKAKSLSNQEIFQSESPMVSRSGSVSRLSRSKNLTIKNTNRPASYHGSFESLQTQNQIYDISFSFNNSEEISDLSYHCPFSSSCTASLKSKDILEHFQSGHSGPFVQYFQPNAKVNLRKIIKRKELSYVIQFEKNVFFLKLELIEKSKAENILVWTWLLGNKKDSKEYDMQINVTNEEVNDVIISVRNSICSLHSTSYKEMRDAKKGVLLNTKTFDNFGKVILDITIVKNDCD